MPYLIALCGFAGAWLLVAGPIWQAALELREEQLDHEMFDRANSAVPDVARVSLWWWLLPPVAYVLQRRRVRIQRDAMFKALGHDELEKAVNFLNKANGWIIVAGGAALLAVKETWELIELLEWPVAVFWILVVVMAFGCIAVTVTKTVRSARILGEEPPARRPRA